MVRQPSVRFPGRSPPGCPGGPGWLPWWCTTTAEGRWRGYRVLLPALFFRGGGGDTTDTTRRWWPCGAG